MSQVISVIVYEKVNRKESQKIYDAIYREIDPPLCIARSPFKLPEEFLKGLPPRIEYIPACTIFPIAMNAGGEYKPRGLFFAKDWYDPRMLTSVISYIAKAGFRWCMMSDDPFGKYLDEPHAHIPYSYIPEFVLKTEDSPSPEKFPIILSSYHWMCELIKMSTEIEGDVAAMRLVKGQEEWQKRRGTLGNSYIAIAFPTLYLARSDRFQFFKFFLETLAKECVLTTISGLIESFPKQEAKNLFPEPRPQYASVSVSHR